MSKPLALVLGAAAAASLGLSACKGNGATFAAPSEASGNSEVTGGGPQSGTGRLKGKVIVLDPGHNGGKLLGHQVNIGNGYKSCDTTGTDTKAGYTEHEYAWDVSKRLRKLLVAEGAKVILTRQNDTGSGPCIDERAAIGNKAKADAVLSIHADGAPVKGRGFHVIQPKVVPGYNDGIIGPSRKLGTAVRNAYKSGTGMPYSTYTGSNGVTIRNDLGGLNLSKVPKIFIETGNMRNPGDAAKLSTPKFRQRIAVSLATGLADYFKRG